MNTWLKSLLIGLATTALALFISQIKAKSNNKQLFTVRFTVEIIPDDNIGQGDLVDAMVKIPDRIRSRCETAGYSASIKVLNDSKNLEINMEHVDDTSYAGLLITAGNKIEFREMYTLNEIPSLLLFGLNGKRKQLIPEEAIPADETADSSKTRRISELVPEKRTEEEEPGLDSIIMFTNSSPLIPANTSFLSEIGSIREKDTGLLNRILQTPELISALPSDIKFYYGPANDLSKSNKTRMLYLYAIRTGGNQETFLNNSDIRNASQDYSISGEPEVTFRFYPAGARKWEAMTTKNTGRFIAMIFDNSVISSPKVNGPITVGSSKISGGFTVTEARMLALMLNSEVIPARFTILQQKISPESPFNNRKLILVMLIAFIIGTGLSYLVFNTLKNS